MKRTMLVLTMLVLLFSFIGVVLAEDVYVGGYYRKDGTYVQPHHRTAPNNSTLDNYSTKGNTNPYTGEKGTVDPYNLNTPAPKSHTNIYDNNILTPKRTNKPYFNSNQD